MENLVEKVNALNSLILEGKAMEAFEKYYHEDVVMQENQGAPTVGKEANRRREAEFFNSLIDFRSAEVLKVAVGEQLTMVEWHYDYTHKEWGDRNYTQVGVQEWKDGKIIKETFYYGN